MKTQMKICSALLAAALLTAGLSACSRNADSPEPAETAVPSAVSTEQPSAVPAPPPTEEPALTTPEPIPEPTEEATAEPAPEPTEEATPEPTEEPTPEPTPEPPTVPTPAPADSPSVLGETADMGQDYLDRITFLGDSTTYGMKAYGVLSGGTKTTQVWTPTSGTLTLSYQGFAAIWYPDEDVEIPIRDAVERKKPEMMVITLGVNGISFMGHDDFVSEYTDLVTDIMELSPDTKVIIQSIFPVASTYEYLGSINNEKIAAANEWLQEIAESTGARYLDTISALIGSDGWLPQDLQNGDGLHLNGDGFAIVLNYIRTHGWES